MERWKLNLYIIWFTQTLSLMSFGLGLPFIPYYIQEMGVTDPDNLKLLTGIISGSPALAMAFMAPVWGMLSDRHGKKLMLLRAIFSAVIVLAGLGFSTAVWQVVFFRVLQGFLTGTVTASSAFVASNTPDNKLSWSLGFLSSSTFIGLSAGPALGGIIAEAFGYSATFFLGALVMFLDFLLVVIIVKEEKKPANCPVRKKIGLSKSLLSVLTPTVITMLIILLFVRMARTVFTPYIALYVQSIRSTVTGSATITGIISGVASLMMALSAVLFGRLGDIHDKIKLLKLFIASSILISILFVFSQQLLFFTIVYCIFMLAVGGVEPILMSITSEGIPSEKRGALFGMQALSGSIGWALSPMLASIISIKFSIYAVLFSIPVLMLISLIPLFIRKNRCQ